MIAFGVFYDSTKIKHVINSVNTENTTKDIQFYIYGICIRFSHRARDKLSIFDVDISHHNFAQNSMLFNSDILHDH